MHLKKSIWMYQFTRKQERKVEGKDEQQLQEGFKISVYNVRTFLNAWYDWSRLE